VRRRADNSRQELDKLIRALYPAPPPNRPHSPTTVLAATGAPQIDPPSESGDAGLPVKPLRHGSHLSTHPYADRTECLTLTVAYAHHCHPRDVLEIEASLLSRAR
jgi:hypothetical protein